MITTPPRDPSGESAFVTWCKRIRQMITERTILAGRNLEVQYTMKGTVIHAVPSGGGTSTGPLNWKGEWFDQKYSANDLVIRGSNNESSALWNAADSLLLDGTQAGVYIALQSVPAGTLAPGEPNTGAYWETMARFSTHISVIKKKGETHAIVIDARAPNGDVLVKLSDCNGKVLSIREVAVCVNGVEKKMMVIGSAPYI